MGTVHAKSFLFHRAQNLSDAVAILSGSTAPAVLAGGQSLVPALRSRRRQPDLVVDIGRLPELRHIEQTTGSGVIVAGAVARQSDVLVAARESGNGLLAAALSSVGTALTRRRGTIGGILAQGDPALQFAAVCSVLDVSVVVRGPGPVHELPATELFTGTALRPAEIVTEVAFQPGAADEGWGFSPMTHRRTGPPLAGAAARIALDADGRCTSVRVAAYTLGHPGGLLTGAGATLIGVRPDRAAVDRAARAAASDVRTGSDALATATYRRHAVQTLIRRALEQSVSRARRPSPDG